jgi:hypothetical protein
MTFAAASSERIGSSGMNDQVDGGDEQRAPPWAATGTRA